MINLRSAVIYFVIALSLTACGTASKPTTSIQNEKPSNLPMTATSPSPSPLTQEPISQVTGQTNQDENKKADNSQAKHSEPASSHANGDKTTPTPTESKHVVSSTTTSSPKQTTQTTTKAEKGKVEIVSVTSPAARNSTATLKAKVAPGATANIVVHYKSGPSTAAGLESKKADANGNVIWSWKVGGNTTLGNWRITVTSDGVSADTHFEVVH